ncbi:hypothetical protein [Thermococcus waiotapuensis]|uniref:Uncharacterized protein n=1 Tax=Thermococcus waiotapuensis TaxID=90909 RepID=A0AAE4NWF7_9EURY|nr:hypothetical protein [Thermococcus waiotapuensis]MDV3103935.1 hypothetical protein [Thermococcus waiotapuensis]
MRRGFVFTLDAMLSLVLVALFITSMVAITDSTSQVYSTYMRSQSQYIAMDTLQTLRTVSLNQLVPQEKINEWLKDGTLDEELVSPEMTPLDIVATYWATEPLYPSMNLRHKAEVILGYVLNQSLKGYNYELLINNYTSPYLREVGSNYSKAPDVSPATLIMSGYAYNQTPRGYMARAYLTKITEKTTSYTYFGSSAFAYAPTNTDYTIVRYYIPNENELPPDANITSVEWFPQPRWFSPSSYMRLFIDGEPVKCGQFSSSGFVKYSTWEILKDSNPNDENSCNMLEILQRHRDLRRHIFEVWVYNPGYQDGESYSGGVHPNSFITLTYTTSQPGTFRYPQTVHFDGIKTSHPFQVENAVFIPGKFRGINVQVKIVNASKLNIKPKLYVTYLNTRVEIGEGTTSGVDVFTWDNSTIMNALKNSKIYPQNLSNAYLWIAVTFGMEYKSPSYGDTTTFKYPVRMDETDSKIDLEYIPPIYLDQYTIDFTKPIGPSSVTDYTFQESAYQTDFYTMLEWKFSIPQGTQPLLFRLHIVRLWNVNCRDSDDYKQSLSIKNDKTGGWITVYSHPPKPFIDPAFTRWGIVNGIVSNSGNPIENALAEGDNYIKAETGICYVMSKEFTTGDFTYAIKAYAGYGDVFPRFMRPGCKGYNITYYWQDSSVTTPQQAYILAGNEPYCSVTTDELLNGRRTYAVDDAIIRLFNNLGGDGTQRSPILVKLPNEVNIDFASMGNIPGLFQPIQITLRVWREG